MRTRLILAAAAALAAASSLAPAAALPGSTGRLSIASSKAEANGDSPARTVPDTTSPAISLDGRWVAFSSDASNLVPADTNRAADVFLRDLQTRTTTRVSVTADGRQANGPSYSPAMSVDGRWLAFASSADNLVRGDDNAVADVFLADLTKGTLERISVSSTGRQANGPSNTPFVSLFGDWVTFESAASNLADGDENALADAFLYTRRTDRVRRITPPDPPAGYSSPLASWTHGAQISYDGRWLSYVGAVKRLRPEAPDVPVPVAPPAVPSAPDVGGVTIPDAPTHLSSITSDDAFISDVYVLNVRSGRARRVKLLAWAGNYRQLADNPAMSADGLRVVFEMWSVVDADSAARNAERKHGLPLEWDVLARNPVDHKDIAMYDRPSRTTNPMSRNPYGLQADGDSTNPQISSQGHVITFSSSATNLVPGDTNGMTDVYVVDTRERATSRVSLGRGFAEASAESVRPQMSYDGRSIVFASPANNLVEGDTNGRWDVFRRDRRTDTLNIAPEFTTKALSTPEELARVDAKGRPTYTVPVNTISPGEETRLRLRARDLNEDALRFGIILARAPNATADPAAQVPDGLTVDPVTGSFRWTPTTNQAGPWVIVFWVEDARGGSHIGLMHYLVRDLRQLATCKASQAC